MVCVIFILLKNGHKHAFRPVPTPYSKAMRPTTVAMHEVCNLMGSHKGSTRIHIHTSHLDLLTQKSKGVWPKPAGRRRMGHEGNMWF